MLKVTLISIILIIVIGAFALCANGETASWYSVESCKREGTWQKYGGKMANGEVFNDKALVCASWDYDFGTLLEVTNLANNKSIVVRVADRGPNRRLYDKGRTIDLSEAAFSRVAKLSQGVIQIQVKEAK